MSKKSSQIRLNKFIAENTGVSRREADELISSRRVEIKEDRGLRIEDRKIAVLGQQISDRDQVFIDGKPMKNRAEHITIILNKPVGYLSSRRSQGGLPAPRQGQHCIYVLKCSDGSFYIGQTNNYKQRLIDHNKGKGAQWVKSHLPFEPIHWEVFKTREESVRREHNLKTGFGRKWLKREYEKGCLAATRQAGDKTVYNLLPTKYRSLKTAGRLDKDSSGLMILSSDGDLIQHLTHPRYQKTKVYEVELDKPLQPLHQQMISDIGIDLPDGKSKFQIEKYRFSGEDSEHLTTNRSSMELTERQGPPQPQFDKTGAGMGMSSGSDRLNSDACEESFTENHYLVTMHEGRNRQIRRTLSALGYDVTKLHRITLGNYSLDNLEPGEYRLVN